MIWLGAVLLLAGVVLRFVLPADQAPGVDLDLWGAVLVLAGIALLVVGTVLRRRRRVAAGEELPPSGGPLERLRALPRLVRAARSGEYPGARRQLLVWLGALVYLVSPIDLLPEVLPLLGIADDAGLLVWLGTSVFGAAGRYLTWERTTSPH
ncbi:MAG TPA: YkvA family protein [Pseudonocardiaceae bacterium]